MVVSLIYVDNVNHGCDGMPGGGIRGEGKGGNISVFLLELVAYLKNSQEYKLPALPANLRC